MLLQSLTQLKGNANTAQLLEGICTVPLLGIYYSVGRRQSIRYRMVVSDDNIQLCRCVFYLVQAADTAVYSYDQRRAAFGNCAQSLIIQAIALTFTLWYIGAHPRTALL